MTTDNYYNQMTDIHLDALREIGNIGSGNAATALSDMLMCKIDINVPVVKILEYNEVVEALGGPETMLLGVLLSLSGDVNGMMMFLQEKDFVHMTLNSLLQQSFSDFNEIDEMGYSAMQEVANIMASSYVNAVGIMTGLNIYTSVPSVTVDMLGALLSVPAIYYADISEKIIFIDDSFTCLGNKTSSHILMIPDTKSLYKIMRNLGLEECN
ncbi:MAG: chemotaxis protein CheC [Oscillospiraceae bacterium]